MSMPISTEDQAIIAFMAKSGVKHRVTATTGTFVSAGNPCSPHAVGSYHCQDGTGGKGLAVDFAEPTASHDSPGLLAIFTAFTVVESHLAELYYSGAPYGIRDGKRITVEKSIRDSHHNHVHVAVHKGTFLVPIQVPAPENGVITVPDVLPGVTGPPDFDLSGTPCAISAVFDSNGNVKGYYVMTDDGSIAALGNIPYLGRVH